VTASRARAWLTVVVVLGAAAVAPPVPARAAGDAERGRAVFTARQCVRCHRADGQSGAGPALEKLRRPQGAFELAGRMWNHAPAMFTALTREAIEWPRLTPADVSDLMVYLQADAARDGRVDPRQGQAVLVAKGCLKCHTLNGEGASLAPDLAPRRPAYDDPAAWGAAIWTHTPRMAAMALARSILYPRFDGSEMANLVAFLKTGGR
jgi:cytochrome c